MNFASCHGSIVSDSDNESEKSLKVSNCLDQFFLFMVKKLFYTVFLSLNFFLWGGGGGGMNAIICLDSQTLWLPFSLWLLKWQSSLFLTMTSVMTLMSACSSSLRDQRKLHLEGYGHYTNSIYSVRIFVKQMEASMPDGTWNRLCWNSRTL